MAEQGYTVRTHSNDEKLVQEKRHHITRRAIKLFAEKGFKGTTMRELAQACGMSQGLIYHYIGAKEDILHLICSMAGVGGPLLRNFLLKLGPVSVTGALIACIREYYRWADEDQENYIFFSREILNFSHEDRALLLKSQTEIIAVFEGLLKAGNESGEFKAENPFLIAHNIVITGFEWALRRWYLRSRFTREEYTDSEIRLVLKQIGVEESKIPGLMKTN